MKMTDSQGRPIPAAEAYRMTLTDRLGALESFLRSQAAARDAQRAALAKLRQQQEQESKLKPEDVTYTPSYFAKQQELLDQQAASANSTAREEAAKLLESFIQVLQARHSEPVDLADPALRNALDIINLVGESIPFAQMTGIVSQFTGNPAALNILRSVFEKQGMTAGVAETNRFIYEPAYAAVSLQAKIDEAFRPGGSINSLATALSDLAQREGIMFPADGEKSVDPAGVLEAMYRGAGLPTPTG